jgi:hypothetical protein
LPGARWLNIGKRWELPLQTSANVCCKKYFQFKRKNTR